MIRYILLPLLLISCANSPKYTANTCFQVEKSVLHIELVTKYDYFISIKRKNWIGSLLEGLVPHDELENTINQKKFPKIHCNTVRSNV